MLIRGLKKAKAVFRPFCIHFYRIRARFRFWICLPELLRARRFLYVNDFYWRKKFQIGQDYRSLPLLAEREALPSFHPTVPAVGLRVRTVRVSGLLCGAYPANPIHAEGSQNTSGIHAAAVPNGSVRRSLTRRGSSLPMRC